MYDYTACIKKYHLFYLHSGLTKVQYCFIIYMTEILVMSKSCSDCKKKKKKKAVLLYYL